MSTACWPWFHTYSQIPGVGAYVSSGCSVGGDGNVGCAPEIMRQAAERKMATLGALQSISLDTYTLARYMQSEVGTRSIEEIVAVGEAAKNRARREGTSITGLLLYRQPAGHPNRGFYGPIHGIGTGTSTAPYGRWASTSQDPTVLALLLADLVTSGRSGDFAQGADDQDGPEAWISQGQTALVNYVKRLASQGKFWVGPLPGVDHWHTFLQFTPDPVTRAALGSQLTARGIAALTLPATRPSWQNMPVCAEPSSSAVTFLLMAIGLASGTLAASWFARRYISTSATATPQ